MRWFFPKFNSFDKKYRNAILSGILMGTSYIPFPPWALWFCFAPLWVFVIRDSENKKQAFFAGWLTQFVLTLIGFHWIAYVSHEYGYMPWSVSIVVLLLFCAGIHLYIPFATLLTRWLKERFQMSILSSLLLGASLISLGESLWPSIFPWNLGYPLLSQKLFAAQTADVFGFWGLSLFFHLTNAFVAWAWLTPGKVAKLRTALGILLFWSLLSVWGYFKKSQWEASQQPLEKNILIIQANIGNFEKVMAEKGRGYQQSIADQYFSVTREAVAAHPNADLIVWPESAFPDYMDSYDHGQKYTSQFISFTKEIGKPILTGGYSRDEANKKPREEYNGLFLFGGDGRILAGPYHKNYLLVFGEYTPLSKTFPILAKYSPAGEGFGQGTGPMVFDFHEDKIGTQICYESLDPQFSSQLVKQGADYFVNVTNDSWFGPTFEPYQHLYMTLGRAVEMRRPLIRSTNTGISTVVMADGTWGEFSPMYKPWFGLFKMKYQAEAPRTIYARFGHTYPWFLILFAVILVFYRKKS